MTEDNDRRHHPYRWCKLCIEEGKRQKRQITKAIDENARHQIEEAIINERNKILKNVNNMFENKICTCGHFVQDHAYNAHMVGCQKNYRFTQDKQIICGCRNTIKQELEKLKGDKT